jgi:prepilin-type N-terminal cleavage/methylation domain-containing protein
MSNNPNISQEKNHVGHSAGFTLVELMISMLVGVIVLGAAYMVFIGQQKTSTVQRDLARMQQNLRAAMYMIKNDIRNCGRDGQMNGTVGIQTITHIATVQPDNGDPTLYPVLSLTSFPDADGDGIADTNANFRTVSYALRDSDNDGLYELERCDDATGVMACNRVVEGLDDISFAFAYDADNDGDLDRFNGQSNNNVIWAVDSNNDNMLDTNVDNNNDGIVDVNDDNGDNVINTTDGNLGTTVGPNAIRAVRIWLLARSRVRDTRFSDDGPFVVGDHVFRPVTVGTVERPALADNNYDQFRRVLLEGGVALANIERIP